MTGLGLLVCLFIHWGLKELRHQMTQLMEVVIL